MFAKKVTAIYCIAWLAVICLEKAEDSHQSYGSRGAKIHHEPNSRVTKYLQPVNAVGNEAPVKNKEIG